MMACGLRNRIAAAGLASLGLLAMQAPPAGAEVLRPKPRPAVALDVALEGAVDAALREALALPGIAPAGLAAARPAARPPAGAIDGGAEDTPLAVSLPPPNPEAADPAAAAPAARMAEPARDPNRGAVTNLPLPRYVSLKTGEGNARRGPGLTHRIDWVFTRAGMPLKLTAEHGHWRRVEDADGLGGWVHYALLSGVRSALVAEDTAEFRARPDENAQVAFKAEAGVVAKVLECGGLWCRVSVEGERGWTPVAALWGVDAGEVIE